MHSGTIQQRGPKGLRGWLILVAIMVVAAPIRIAVESAVTFYPIFSSATWSQMTDLANPAYDLRLTVIILAEIAANAALALAWFYTAYLFFTKSHRFPLWFRSVLIGAILFILVDAFAIKLVMPDTPLFDETTIKNLVRGVVAAAIWVPYSLLSKRVRNTFVDEEDWVKKQAAVFE